MKMILLVAFPILGILFSLSAYSTDWTAVTKSKKGTHYIDVTSISKKSGYVYYRTLDSIKRPTKDGARSVISKNKGDCRSFKIKPYVLKFYEGSMGRGRLLAKVTDGEWMPVASPPLSKSSFRAVLNLVCEYAQDR